MNSFTHAFLVTNDLSAADLAPVDFSGAVFTCTHFQRNSPNIQLMLLSLHKQRNSFTHAFLVTNDLSAANLVQADFCQT